MKKWFNNLTIKQRKIISISLSILSGIVFVSGMSIGIYIVTFLGVCLFIPSILLLNKIEKIEKENKNKSKENLYYEQNENQSELVKYKDLICNDFTVEEIKTNFECSLKIMELEQIKANKNFNSNDLSFDIDNKILELVEKGKSFFLQSKYRDFIAIDVETTGLSPDYDRIIQIALIKVDNGTITEKYVTLINPQIHITYSASEINNIYDSDVKCCKTIKELFPEILVFIENYPLVAHNAKFDLNFLKKEYERNFEKRMPSIKNLCTMKLWRELYYNYFNSNVPSAKLNTLVLNLLTKSEVEYYMSNKHDAYCDAVSVAKVFMKLYDNSIEEKI